MIYNVSVSSSEVGIYDDCNGLFDRLEDAIDWGIEHGTCTVHIMPDRPLINPDEDELTFGYYAPKKTYKLRVRDDVEWFAWHYISREKLIEYAHKLFAINA